MSAHTSPIEPQRPAHDLAAGRVSLSQLHLNALGRAARNLPVDDDAAVAALTRVGIVEPSGAVSEPFKELAAAASFAVARIVVTRLSAKVMRRVLVTWCPEGVIALRDSEPDLVQEVSFSAPTSLARILGQLLQLGPRPRPESNARAVDLTVSELLAPFNESDPGWLARLGVTVDDVVLNRVDLALASGGSTVGVLDSALHGCWEVATTDGGAFQVTPTDSLTVLSTLSAWQASLVDVTDPQC